MGNKDTNKSAGLQLVLERNSFYNEGHGKLVFAIFLLLLVSVFLISSIAYKVSHPAEPQYFAATPSGRILQIFPLSKPVVTDSYVLQWTANKVRLAFAQDYLHWRQQLQDISQSFTPDGWKYFVSSLKSSNNLSTLSSYKMISNAEVIGSPIIEKKALINGRFTWKIRISILVTYSNVRKSIPMPMDVTLIVVRMPVQNYSDRIAINNFLPILESNNSIGSM